MLGQVLAISIAVCESWLEAFRFGKNHLLGKQVVRLDPEPNRSYSALAGEVGLKLIQNIFLSFEMSKHKAETHVQEVNSYARVREERSSNSAW